MRLHHREVRGAERAAVRRARGDGGLPGRLDRETSLVEGERKGIVAPHPASLVGKQDRRRLVVVVALPQIAREILRLRRPRHGRPDGGDSAEPRFARQHVKRERIRTRRRRRHHERCDGWEVVARIEPGAGARIGDRAVVQHRRAGRNVDVVDAFHVGLVAGNASLFNRLLERLHDREFLLMPAPEVERPPRALRWRLGKVDGVGEQLRHGLRRLLVFKAVVVADEHDRSSPAEVLHALDDEQHPLLARLLALVVRVCVGERERPARSLVLQDGIRADPLDGRAPRLGAGHVWRLGEPERPVRDGLEPVATERHGRRLAVYAVRVPALADERIGREPRLQPFALVRQNLLESDHIGVLLLDHAREVVAPRLPVVVRGLPVARRIADVVRHHAHLRQLRRRANVGPRCRRRGKCNCGRNHERILHFAFTFLVVTCHVSPYLPAAGGW